MTKHVTSEKTVWGLRRGRKDALPNLIGGWRGFMWHSDYYKRNGKNFAPSKGDLLRVWKQEQCTKWRVFQGTIQDMRAFAYQSRDEVEPFFGDDPTYLWDKNRPDVGMCVAIRCDLTLVHEADDCPIEGQQSWQKME